MTYGPAVLALAGPDYPRPRTHRYSAVSLCWAELSKIRGRGVSVPLEETGGKVIHDKFRQYFAPGDGDAGGALPYRPAHLWR